MVLNQIQIILVDDQPFIREAVKDLLKSEKHIVIAAEFSNGEDVIKTIDSLKLPDIILMDISMPGMDGIKTTELLVKDLPDIKILGFTLHDNKNFHQAMIKAGARGLISKVASKNQLLHAINEVVAGNFYLL